MSMVDLATLVPEHFSPRTGETFLITAPGGGRFEMTLWKVRISSHKVPRGFRHPFAIEFKPPPGPPLPQGLFLIEHEALGTMELMMTPVQSIDGCHYEAVFG